jgi:hypothetical protein
MAVNLPLLTFYKSWVVKIQPGKKNNWFENKDTKEGQGQHHHARLQQEYGGQ